jgi:hypothetical protein
MRALLAAIWRFATGRRARRLYLAVILLVVALSGVIRVRSFLLTRKIQAVISGLQQLRVDVSPEEAVLALPYLPLQNRQQGSVVTYAAQLSNRDDWYWINEYGSLLWPFEWPFDFEKPRVTKWQSLSMPLWAAYVLGWRNISFEAHVTVVDRVVSSVQYAIEPDVLVKFPADYMVAVRSVHALWGSAVPVPIGDVDDEAPAYRFGGRAGILTSQLGAGGAIGLAYTPDAPRDVVVHAFDARLRCFWDLFGCASARDVQPRLWQDREDVIRAAGSRVGSPNPCPDTMLAARARSLPDLVVELREVTDPRLAGATSPLAPAASSRPGYRLLETIRSSAGASHWFARHMSHNTYASGYLWYKDAAAPSLKAGDRVLVFLGVDFQSCRVVPATPSAEAAIRTAPPAPRRPTDDYFNYLGRQ